MPLNSCRRSCYHDISARSLVGTRTVPERRFRAASAMKSYEDWENVRPKRTTLEQKLIRPARLSISFWLVQPDWRGFETMWRSLSIFSLGSRASIANVSTSIPKTGTVVPNSSLESFRGTPRSLVTWIQSLVAHTACPAATSADEKIEMKSSR
jgi:hypothetical protein